MADRIVVVPGRGVLPADTPIVRADDRGLANGDGVFETLHVREGTPWLLDGHLDRMARSAALLELALPPRDQLAGLARTACAAWRQPGEAVLRLVCTRGPDGSTEVTWFATVSAVGEQVRRERRDGVRVLSAGLGVTATGRAELPWLLAGVKSLSYAPNLAARRWAVAHGADDVLWTSTDGYVLEAPTANVVWLDRGVLCTVPADSTGILPGVTAAHLLARAGEVGLAAEERMVTAAGLAAAEGLWFTSSVRGLAEVRWLDGTARPPATRTPLLRGLLGHPT